MYFRLLFGLIAACISLDAHAVSSAVGETLSLITTWQGFIAIGVFVFAYIFVILEEQIEMRKSKPVLVAAGIIWILIAVAYAGTGQSAIVESAIRHNFLEYAELFFFLLVAMTYINAMLERDVFNALRDYLTAQGFSYRGIFWLTGILAFFISPIADNLTTALVMCAVILSVGGKHKEFIGIGCVNIVVAANAGGAFSPFGDITTLMVWQKGILSFTEFFALFVPSVVNFMIPAAIMSLALPKGKPEGTVNQQTLIKTGGLVIVGLFIATIVTAVSFHNFLHLPPVYGMMFGLGYLKLYSYYLKRLTHNKHHQSDSIPSSHTNPESFDIFSKIAKAEWDTLFFFYGVILAVGGLGFMGYLTLASEFMYGTFGPTGANVLVGMLSAIVDNIPVMFAVLTMLPEMSHNQWLLVTLTAGVGGSLLSVGSAAGVALMGQARGYYTFFTHLRWTPVVALGYAASIVVHFWINGA